MKRIPQVRETLLDRAIAYFSPAAAVERRHARLMLAASGAYVGARRDRAATKAWSVSDGSADADLLPDLAALRSRSRDLDRNAPLARGAINTVVTNVVGGGLKLKACIDADVLGLSDEEKEEWERQAEAEFDLATGSREIDLSRRQVFAELQDLAFRSVLVNGDCLVIRALLERPGSPYATKLQLVEGDRVCNPDYRADTLTLAGGVETDSFGAPIAFHVAAVHPGDWGRGANSWQRIEAFGARTGMPNALHLFVPLRVGQRRGEPYLAPVIEAFKQLTNYAEAEIAAAVISAMFTVFITTPDTVGDGQLTEGESAGSTDEFQLKSGAVLDLAPGEKPEFANPSRPNANFDPFVLATLRQIGVALELPFEVLVKHFTASYSAARAALLEAWKFFRRRRVWLQRSLCQPVYEWIIAEAVARGRLQAPGFFDDPLIRKAWLGAEWIGDAPGQIDPEKEARANQLMVENGWKTNEQVTAEMTGGDWEDNHRQRVKEEKLRRDGGLATANGVRAGQDASRPGLPPPANDSDQGGDQPENEATPS